jgi:hypothetical protein
MFAAGNSLLAAAFFAQVHLCATSAVPVVASRGRAIQCSATAFDRQLKVVLAEAETIGATAALRAHLDDLDEEFIPMLGDLIDEANGIEAERLLAIMSAFDEIYPSPVTMSNDVLDTHWRRFDGTIEDDEEAYVDLFAQPEGSPRPSVDERPSAYGEVSREGARRLFRAMGLDDARGAVFADLGSGAGRLVAQAWLELPSVEHAIGIELAPSRHAAAVRAWASVVAAGADHAALALSHAGKGTSKSSAPEWRCASLLDTDLSAVTHVYVSSLCMGDALMDALWTRLSGSVPTLETVATLRAFRAPEAAAFLVDVAAHVQMTWNRPDSPGTLVFIYKLR